ncbi:unnamed protein product [Prunus brigantina]
MTEITRPRYMALQGNKKDTSKALQSKKKPLKYGIRASLVVFVHQKKSKCIKKIIRKALKQKSY